MRVRFAEPRPPGHTVYDHVLLPRLGLPLMATMLTERGHDAAVFCEMLTPIDLAECLSADLVGLSATTSTAPASYRLCDQASAAGIDTAIGGPHVSFCVEEALEHARFVVRGEGHQTLLELVEALEHRRQLDSIGGLSWRDERGELHHNPDRGRCSQAEFESLPIPDLTLIRGHEKMGVKPIMTQWGCPFDCDFCSVTAQFSRVVRYRRTDQVLEELRGLDAIEVFFYDDNFVVNKHRTRDLLEAMITTGLTPCFSAQVRADMVLKSRARGEIDHEFLELMHAAGCETVMIGFESISDANLAQVGKKLTVELSEQAVRAFHDHGIAVHGMFVNGLDRDDVHSARETADFATRLGIDTFQLMIITPAVGTRLNARIKSEGRLVSEDWKLYDGHHAVLHPKLMSALELQLSTQDALGRFYSRRAIASAALRSLGPNLPSLMAIVARRAGTAGRAAGRELRAARRERGAGETSAIAIALTQVERSLTKDERNRVRSALFVPAIRAYGRHQIAVQSSQRLTLDHMNSLAELDSAPLPETKRNGQGKAAALERDRSTAGSPFVLR
ncbi:MAG: B12-binding domain-containing radical SAM protein [Solirubrobacteraceae bacterium]